MKKLLYIICLLGLPYSFIEAQETSAKLKEAETAYNSHKLDDARIALQTALEGINKEIGNEILKLLPVKLSDITYNQKDDNVSGATGYAGLFINRSFGDNEKTAKIEVLGDSPLLTSINALLSVPTFMTGSNSNDKKVKVAGYKGLLNKSVGDNNITNYTLQIPISQTLVTFTVKGTYSETEVMAMANTIPFDKIAKYAQ